LPADGARNRAPDAMTRLEAIRNPIVKTVRMAWSPTLRRHDRSG
jgi:hypothetical protein